MQETQSRREKFSTLQKRPKVQNAVIALDTKLDANRVQVKASLEERICSGDLKLSQKLGG